MNNLFSKAAWNTELEDMRHEDIVRQMSEQHIPPQYMPDDTRAWLEAEMAAVFASLEPTKPVRPASGSIVNRFANGQIFDGKDLELWRGLFTPDPCPTGETP